MLLEVQCIRRSNIGFYKTMRLTLKAINDELANRGYSARLIKSTGYFYFQSGETASWLDGLSTCEPLTEWRFWSK
jgi:hypothetical protein